MKKMSYIMVIFFVLLGLVFLTGCSDSTDDSGSKQTTVPTSDSKSDSGNSNSGSAVKVEDWKNVKVWKGTVSMTRVIDDQKEVPMSDNTKKITLRTFNETLDGTFEINDMVELDENEYLWIGEFDVNVSLERVIEATTYKNGVAEVIETSTSIGNGVVTVFPEDGSGLHILVNEGFYNFAINPGPVDVELHEKMVVNGVVASDKSVTTYDQRGVGVGVGNIPLPKSGMELKGKETLEDGTIVEWSFIPVE